MASGWAVAGVVVGLLAGYVIAGLQRARDDRRRRLRSEAFQRQVLTVGHANEDLVDDLRTAARLLAPRSADAETGRALRGVELAIVDVNHKVMSSAEQSTRQFWLGMATGALLAIIGIGFTIWTTTWT